VSSGVSAGWIEILSRVMNVGLLLVGPGGRLEFASDTALGVLNCSRAEIEKRWRDIKAALCIDQGESEPISKPRRCTVDLPTPSGVCALRLEIHSLERQSGFLILLRDRKAGDVLETDLLLASRMRSLVHVYRVLAHDLKAPLNAMQLTLELLADATAYEHGVAGNTRRQRHIEVLREELARLNRILQSMLDQKEPIASIAHRFDIREVIREIIVLLAPQARAQRVDLQVTLPDEPLALRGYRDRIKQALLNIAINALEAMPSGGRLDISLGATVSEARVRITDTGPGIPDESMDQIYQIYFTSKGTGNGIGLYVARVVVETHGGQIAVSSESGRGTTFTIALPMRVETTASVAVATGGMAS
jgi:signal transduction histidine kinase